MWNLFKVNNEETRTTSLTLFWCLCCKLSKDLTHFSGASLIDIEQVNAGWVIDVLEKRFWETPKNCCENIHDGAIFQTGEPINCNFAKLRTLTYFMLLVLFYTPWKHQKISNFLIFSENIEDISRNNLIVNSNVILYVFLEDFPVQWFCKISSIHCFCWL